MSLRCCQAFDWITRLRTKKGECSTPEGKLRQYVFVSTDTKNFTVERGASSSVHGALGMAGVGETTALIGPGHEGEMKAHFVDGVLYMSLGAAATKETVANELSKILELTGAVSRASEVASASSLSKAVSRTAIWFYGKRILFLIDDIWPSPGRPEGFLQELGGLIQGSPESRIAISTRCSTMAVKTGSHVDF